MLNLLHCAWSFLALPPLAPTAPDNGYDLLLLDMPHRAVMGEPLRFAVRGRPGNPYVVFGDVGNNLTRFGRLDINLTLSPVLFVAGMGVLPAHGSAPHALLIPNVPAADGSILFFQAFGTDEGVFGGFTASDGKPVTFHKEQNQPLIPLFTVNRIPRDQNGAERNEGTIRVPEIGFTVDLFFEKRGRGPIDPQSLVVVADQPLAAGAIPPNTNLAQFFTIGSDQASGLVSSAWAFPANTLITLTADVKNAAGASAPRETYAVRCYANIPSTRPFATKQIWWVDFDAHDLDRSGLPDYREDLLLFGLGNDAADRVGSSARVDLWTRQTIQSKLRQHYGVGNPDGINIDFSIVRPSGTHARICVGGRNPIPASQLPPGAQETTGAAYLNPLNQSKSIVNCFSVVGVHPRSVFHLFKNVPAFGLVFGPLQSAPVGSDPDDPIVTDPTFDPSRGTARQRARYVTIRNGVEALGNAVSFILVQETCHSMGLVEGGGLNGGMLSSFQREIRNTSCLSTAPEGSQADHRGGWTRPQVPRPGLLPRRDCRIARFRQSGAPHRRLAMTPSLFELSRTSRAAAHVPARSPAVRWRGRGGRGCCARSSER